MKVQIPKGHEIVANSILTNIKTGEWQPGIRIPSVVELSQAYGVGRSTIREAISALKATGWLDVRQGGGTFVKLTLPSEESRQDRHLFDGADSLIELLEVRIALEVKAVSLAAKKRALMDLTHLEAALAAMEDGLHQNDTAASERADVEFHLAIAAASGNSVLIQLMASLQSRFTASIRQSRKVWFYREQASASLLLHEHRQIYEAIKSQDTGLAVRRMTEHLSKVEQILCEVLE